MLYFPIPEKISKRINKVVKSLYLDYRNNKMKVYTSSVGVYVQGNSNAYAQTIVFPEYEINRNRVFIFTRVDKDSKLTDVYILSTEDVFNHSWKIPGKNGFDFYQIKYKNIEKYRSDLLLKLVENYFQNK